MSNISFMPPAFFPAGTVPRGIAHGDFNGDGNIDLAVVNEDAATVSILLGNGAGGFTLTNSYSVGVSGSSTSREIVAADLNGNGRLDLIITNYTNSNITILFGNGNGTFQPGLSYGVGTNPIGIVAVDLNGNGSLDLAIAEYAPSNRIFVLWNNGSGLFLTATAIQLNTGAWGITYGDFNGDGIMDLAVSIFNSYTIAVIINNGNNTFQPPVYYNTGIFPRGIISRDINNDGKLDLIVTNETNNNIAILLGNGNGSFQNPTYSTVQPGNSPWALAGEDFTEDGKIDIVSANSITNNVSFLTGLGNGTFEPPIIFGSGSNPWDITAADFNNDGKIDLAITNSASNNITILLNNTILPVRGASIFDKTEYL